MHPSGHVSIEREPPDDNSRYPLEDLPPYAYHQAVENFARNCSDNDNHNHHVRVVPMAPPPGAIVIEDSDSEESDEDSTSYDYPGDLSQLSTESYDEIEAIDRALTLSMTQQ